MKYLRAIYEVVDWNKGRLQKRSRSSTNSEKMLKVSEILLETRKIVEFDVVHLSLCFPNLLCVCKTRDQGRGRGKCRGRGLS